MMAVVSRPLFFTTTAGAETAWVAAAAILVGLRSFRRLRALGLGVDVDHCAHSGAERFTIGAVDDNADGDALGDLHPVARGVLGRDQRELGTGPGADRVDVALEL